MSLMNRNECFRALHRHLTDEIVVSTYSSAHEWLTVSDRALDHYSWGAMGLASSHALGLALGLPDRRIVVLDGDGSLLMNLGTLVTIAAAAPRNLLHFVCQNNSYEANGGHPLAHKDIDFVGIARTAGIHACHSFSNVAEFAAALPQLLHEPGPVFAALKVGEDHALSRDYADLFKPSRRAALRAALHAER